MEFILICGIKKGIIIIKFKIVPITNATIPDIALKPFWDSKEKAIVEKICDTVSKDTASIQEI